MTEPPLLLALDLTGTFVFAVNGALTGLEEARLDIVGMVALGMVTAVGGGIVRDILIGAVPPAAFNYLPIDFLDAAGLSLFCVTGATKSLQYGLGIVPAVILGAVTGVGGGTIRDVLVRQVPAVLTSSLYAIPALVGAAITVTAVRTGVYGVPAALGAALACFLIRAAAIRYHLNAPVAPEIKEQSDQHG
jgi:uncharacterized membrane protein YeiH